jgi:cellulose synthase/poly-beta-1,6-N-acetylglucosamine synthase-like glycosyltransferase
MAHFIYLSLGIALLTLASPLVLELALVTAAGWIPKRQKQEMDSPHGGPSLAVIIPAHNEEFLIARCVRSVRNSATSNTRIFVVAHNCADSTGEQARKAGAEVLRYDDPTSVGKGYALRHGFEHALAAQADAVLVIDADSVTSANLVPAVQCALAAGAEAVQCRYDMESATDSVNGRLAALALRGFNVIRPRGRERLGLSVGIFGNGFALRRELLDQVPYGAYSVVEDLEYHVTLVLADKRVHFLETALVSATLPASRKGETVQRSRWEGGRLHAARAWFWPLFKQVSRGRLRLLEPLFDLISLPMAYAVFALLLALCLPVGWIRMYAALSLLVIFGHVLAAAANGPDFLKTLGLLAMAPFYIFWKLRLIPAVLSGSNSQAAWVRTQRDTSTL